MKPVLTALLCATSPLMALNIELDFSHDEAADQFFSSNPAARSAVQKAAQDIGDMLSNSMSAITQDTYNGSNGDTNASFDWSWSYINPVTGSQETINNPGIAEDTIVIYAGTRNLSGSTLGQGGAGGAGLLISGSGYPSEWIGAVAAAETASNTAMSRGSGPTLGSISGSANFGGYVANYELDYGIAVGNLWFDADTDNNGKRDSNATLGNYWHYDTETSVASGKTDLYSVALHEILHVIGLGTSQTWDDLASGSQWLGSEAAAIAGSANIIDSSGSHVESGLLSARVRDGVLQESVISPTITPGVRKELTLLDLAFLTDVGYGVANLVPEPSSMALLTGTALLLLPRRKRQAHGRAIGGNL